MIPHWCQIDFNRSDFFTKTSPYVNGGAARYRGMTLGTTASGDAPTIVTDPVDGLRYVARLRTSTGAGSSSRVKFRVVQCPVGNPISVPLNTIDEFYFEMEVGANWQSGASKTFRMIELRDETDTAIASVECVSGKLRTNIIATGTGVTSASTQLTEGAYGTLTVYWKSGASSTGQIKVYWEGTEVTDIAQTHSQSASMSYILPVSTAVTTGQVYSVFIKHATLISKTLYDRYASIFGISIGSLFVPDRELGQNRDISTTSASILCKAEPGRVRVSWAAASDMKAMVRYIQGDPPVDGETGLTNATAVDLTTADQWTNFVILTGLTPGKTYSYKVRIYSDATPSTYYETGWRRFETKPATKVSSWDVSWASCQSQEKGGVLELFYFMHKNGSRELYHLGDLVYNDSEGGGEPSSSTCPVADKELFIRFEHHYAISDPFFAYFAQRHGVHLIPDDHDFMENNSRASYRLGYTEAEFMGVGINPTGGNGGGRANTCQDDDLAAGSVTRGTLYDAGREAYFIMAAKGMLNRAFSGDGTWQQVEYSRHFDFAGELRFVLCDSRTFQDDAGTQPTNPKAPDPCMYGAFEYWIADKVETLTNGCGRIFQGGIWNDIKPVTSTDNLHDIDPDARQNIEQGAKVPWGVRSGDRHYAAVDKRFGTEVAGRTIPASKFTTHAVVGPSSKGVMPAFDDTWDTTYNVLFASVGQPSVTKATADKSSMYGIERFNTEAGTATMEIWEGEIDQKLFTYTEHYRNTKELELSVGI